MPASGRLAWPEVIHSGVHLPSKFPAKMESWLGMLKGYRPKSWAFALLSPRCLALAVLT